MDPFRHHHSYLPCYDIQEDDYPFQGEGMEDSSAIEMQPISESRRSTLSRQPRPEYVPMESPPPLSPKVYVRSSSIRRDGNLRVIDAPRTTGLLNHNVGTFRPYQHLATQEPADSIYSAPVGTDVASGAEIVGECSLLISICVICFLPYSLIISP